jgi:hypothetical protein
MDSFEFRVQASPLSLWFKVSTPRGELEPITE